VRWYSPFRLQQNVRINYNLRQIIVCSVCSCFLTLASFVKQISIGEIHYPFNCLFFTYFPYAQGTSKRMKKNVLYEVLLKVYTIENGFQNQYD